MNNLRNNCYECNKLSSGLCSDCFYKQDFPKTSDQKIEMILQYLFILDDRLINIQSKLKD